MADSFAFTAAKITCSACAVASDAVKIVSFNPFQVKPPNLLDQSFKSVGIDDDAHLAVFRKAAAQLSPDAVQADILGQDIDPTKNVSLFSDFLEALLAQAALGGNS